MMELQKNSKKLSNKMKLNKTIESTKDPLIKHQPFKAKQKHIFFEDKIFKSKEAPLDKTFNLHQAALKNLQKQYYIPSLLQSFSHGNLNEFVKQFFREHLISQISALKIASTWNLKPLASIQDKQVYLPNKSMKSKTLIFDMDETLIHSVKDSDIVSDYVLSIPLATGEQHQVKVNLRPHVREVLQELSQYYEIIVFTASQSNYANVILDCLDPKRNIISHRLYRENCIKSDENFLVKDLRIIANRNLNEVLLIDNLAFSYAFNQPNGVPIIPFYDNKQDLQLLDLLKYLKAIYPFSNIASINGQVFQIQKYFNFDNPLDLIESLYASIQSKN